MKSMFISYAIEPSIPDELRLKPDPRFRIEDAKLYFIDYDGKEYEIPGRNLTMRVNDGSE